MARKKITQNVNKDAGLLAMPKVSVEKSRWETPSSNYLTCDIGDIVPIFVDEVLPNEERRITMQMLSHMTNPIAPIFNAQYTEFRSWYIPYRLCADLLAGYKTRKSPWVKVFGEDNVSSNANIVVPLQNQKLPDISGNLFNDFSGNLSSFHGVADSLDAIVTSSNDFSHLNLLDFAAYELIYQKGYRDQNRESATNSPLYKWLFDIYNRTNANTISYQYADAFHKANREKDYFTGASPFTQKSNNAVAVGLVGEAPLTGTASFVTADGADLPSGLQNVNASAVTGAPVGDVELLTDNGVDGIKISLASVKANLASAGGVDINQLRLMIKTQELLEKDMMYGSDMASSLNAHFGCAPMSLVLEEPLELKKVTITSTMQPIFQTSSTANEQTILGTIGANATTQSGEFEIVPKTKFFEYGLLVICAVHKAQNSYDSKFFKPKRIYKHGRFDFYTPELNDLGYQPIIGGEFNPVRNSFASSVGYNEAWAEYRYKFNRVHGMFEPSRTNALSYWTLACSDYLDIASLYKQDVTELNRAISADNTVAPQFFDAYGFVEDVTKPMSLHSIPGMDGVI